VHPQLVAGQEQATRDITKLHAAEQETLGNLFKLHADEEELLENILKEHATEQETLANVLDKISAPPPRPAAATVRKPPPGALTGTVGDAHKAYKRETAHDISDTRILPPLKVSGQRFPTLQQFEARAFKGGVQSPLGHPA
jgi:hypothetical protein